MPPFRAIPPEEIARLRRLYEKTSVPVRDLALMAGMGVSTFLRRVTQWGWIHRNRRIADFDRAQRMGLDLVGLTEDTDPLMATVETARVLAKAREAIEAQVVKIAEVLKSVEETPLRSPDAERAARTLGAYLRLMREMSTVQGGAGEEAADEFRDLDAFCAEITRRLEGLRRGDPE
jgi:hypothetical protein